jgi:hypothetical protein
MNYRVNMGAMYSNFPKPEKGFFPGPFELGRPCRPADIVDGLSTTALISERVIGDYNSDRWTPQRDYWFADLNAHGSPDLDAAVGICAALPPGLPPHYSASGSTWYLFGYDNTFYNHVTAPNSATPDCSGTNIYYGSRGGADGGIFAARSMHGHGAIVGKADGSVLFVKGSISINSWRAAGTRAGREAAESF